MGFYLFIFLFLFYTQLSFFLCLSNFNNQTVLLNLILCLIFTARYGYYISTWLENKFNLLETNMMTPNVPLLSGKTLSLSCCLIARVTTL